jgi:hypothetical protein
MKAIVNVLGALVLTGLGIAMVHLTSGWIGYQWTIWGCAILVFISIVAGIGHTVIEGIVVTGIFAGLSYLILINMPELLPIICGAIAGFNLYMIIIGILAELEEAPLRETEQRAYEKQQAREKTARQEEKRKREADRQNYREHVANLPIPVPKADIRECLEAFRANLNRVWSRLPPELFELQDGFYEYIHTWLQRQFIHFVEKPLGCQLYYYGDYDQEYDDDYPGKKPIQWELPQSRMMEIWVNGKYTFDSLVSVHDGWHHIEPPFDCVLVYGDVDPNQPRYIPLDQAKFELRPAD